MRRTPPLLVWLALVLLLVPSASGSDREFEGTGEVPIVGGNQVSARKRAILAARRDAVSKAVAALLPEGKMTELQQSLSRDIYARAGLYVRTYRVLEEAKQARLYRVKIAAQVLVSRLRQDLSRLTGESSGNKGLPDEPTRVAVEVSFGPGWPQTSQARARAASRKLLEDRGLQLTLAASAQKPAPLPPGSDMLGLLLDAPQRQTIRGTGWPTVQVTALLTLARSGSSSPTAQAKAQAWGASPHGIEPALGDALTRAVGKAFALLRRDPAARAALDRVKPGWLQVRVNGITSPRQIRQLRRLICEEVASGGRCLLTDVGKGMMHLAAETRQLAKTVGTALSGRQLENDFKLTFKQDRGARVWLEVIHAPPAEVAAPDAGVSQ